MCRAGGALRRELARHPRTGRTLRRPRRKEMAGQRGKLAGTVNISDRPAEAADRAVPGHCEGDMIEGKAGRPQIGTLVERTTRYTMLVPLLDGKTAEAFAAAVTGVIAGLPDSLRRSLAWDQGKEMALHAQIAVAADCKIYCCDPRSPPLSGQSREGRLRETRQDLGLWRVAPRCGLTFVLRMAHDGELWDGRAARGC